MLPRCQAARGYWEATRIDPNLSTAWIRLAQVVRSLRSKNPSIVSCITEAEAWSAAATTLNEAPAEDLETLRAEILENLKKDKSWQSKDAQMAITIDLSSFPTPAVKVSAARRLAHSLLAPERSSTDLLQQ